MSSYTALLALSQQHTRDAEAQAASAVAEMQRKMDDQRKAHAAREAKEKALELRLRKQRLEEAQREEERQARKEAERQAKLKAIATREAQQRDVLLYGPKKAKSESAKQREPKQGNRSSRSSRSSQSPEPSTGPALTREELREQKKLAEMRRSYSDAPSSSKRGVMAPSSKRKSTKHLAGGAVPIVTTTVGLPANLSEASGKTTKERIAAVPLTLTKLNIVKRDVRTIDEILRDRERERQANKVISGAEAKEFSDWFSKGKKKETEASSTSGKETPPSRKDTPPVMTAITSSQTSTSTAASRGTSMGRSTPVASTATSSIVKPVPAKAAAPHAFLSKPHLPSHASSPRPATPTTLGKVPTAKSHTSASSASFKKRPRSPSFSPEPAPKKRAYDSGSGAGAARQGYLPSDVLSLLTRGRTRDSFKYDEDEYDSSDMEADVFSQEKEERISARAAKREDEEAMLELKRHEEEKRRKRLQKEREAASKKMHH